MPSPSRYQGIGSRQEMHTTPSTTARASWAGVTSARSPVSVPVASGRFGVRSPSRCGRGPARPPPAGASSRSSSNHVMIDAEQPRHRVGDLIAFIVRTSGRSRPVASANPATVPVDRPPARRSPCTPCHWSHAQARAPARRPRPGGRHLSPVQGATPDSRAAPAPATASGASTSGENPAQSILSLTSRGDRRGSGLPAGTEASPEASAASVVAPARRAGKVEPVVQQTRPRRYAGASRARSARRVQLMMVNRDGTLRAGAPAQPRSHPAGRPGASRCPARTQCRSQSFARHRTSPSWPSRRSHLFLPRPNGDGHRARGRPASARRHGAQFPIRAGCCWLRGGDVGGCARDPITTMVPGMDVAHLDLRAVVEESTPTTGGTDAPPGSIPVTSWSSRSWPSPCATSASSSYVGRQESRRDRRPARTVRPAPPA